MQRNLFLGFAIAIYWAWSSYMTFYILKYAGEIRGESKQTNGVMLVVSIAGGTLLFPMAVTVGVMLHMRNYAKLVKTYLWPYSQAIWFMPRKVLVLRANPDDFPQIAGELRELGMEAICKNLDHNIGSVPLSPDTLNAMFLGGNRALNSQDLGKGGVPLVCAVLASEGSMGYANHICKNLGIQHVVLGNQPGRMSVSEGVSHIKACFLRQVEYKLDLQLDAQGL